MKYTLLNVTLLLFTTCSFSVQVIAQDLTHKCWSNTSMQMAWHSMGNIAHSQDSDDLPDSIKALVRQFANQLELVESESEFIADAVNQFMSQAPNEEMAEAALLYLKSVVSPRLLESIEQAISGELRTPVSVVIQNVMLIDSSGQSPIENAALVMSEGLITDIITNDQSAIPSGAEVIDLQGYYVMPGLIDAHVHLATDPSSDPLEFVEQTLQSMLGSGITALRDMGGDGRALGYYARQTLLGDITGPDIYYSAILAGPEFFSDPRVRASSRGVELGTASWAHEVNDSTDLTLLMQRIKGIGATGVKLYADIDADLTSRIIVAAKEAGLQSWSHWAVFPANARNTVLAGVQVVSHADMVTTALDEASQPDLEHLSEFLSESGCDELWEQMRDKGTILDATLAVYGDLTADDFVMTTRGREEVPPPLLAQAVVRAAHEAGVSIAAGSDSPGDGTIPGGHVEYRLLEASGMTPMDVLHSATVVNARTVGRDNQIGMIEIGKDATFLVFDEDPTASTHDWAAPLYVVKRGVIFSGEKLRSNAESVSPLLPSSLRSSLLDDGAPQKIGEPEPDEDFAGVNVEVTQIFSEHDTNGDDQLQRTELPTDMHREFDEADTNNDGVVTREELLAAFAHGDEPAQFAVSGNVCVMTGVIGPSTPGRVRDLIREHPGVKIIEMREVPGSMDDVANLEAARIIREHGFTTHVPADGIIASGGVDFFLAGARRSVVAGGQLGVHSWGGVEGAGCDLPREDSSHRLYLDFYKEIGIKESFYWYTLEAARPNAIHWMTSEEIEKFDVVNTARTLRSFLQEREHVDESGASLNPATKRQGDNDELHGEAKMILALMDLNDDGQLQSSELEGDARTMLGVADANKDGTITRSELRAMSPTQIDVHSKLAKIDTYTNPQRIVDLPVATHKALNRFFPKYTNVLAPNGRPIHILAMDGWSNDRILRVRKVLEHFLRDAPSRQWGSKTALANAMADNHATMVLLNHQRDMDRVMPSVEGLNLQMQDLRANESPYEGESDYMQHETRDAAYEEVFHLIHASGVLFAMTEYDREIRKLAKAATKSDLWNYDEPNMPGNHFEYIICVYDNYLDLWKTQPTKMEGRTVGQQPAGISFGGEYKADTRAATLQADPLGFDMVEKFNPDHITYTVELPEAFEGVFSMSPHSGQRYAEKAKHLLNATLRGNNPAGLVGNTQDNRMVGNDADNVLTGNGGEDSLFGGGGRDTAVFRGNRSQYVVRRIGDLLEVHDSVVNRDGYDVLSSIEVLKFNDGPIESITIAN